MLIAVRTCLLFLFQLFASNAGLSAALSVPFVLVPVGVVLSGRLLESDVCQHVPHGHHQTIHLLVQLLADSRYFHVILLSQSALKMRGGEDFII